LGRPSNRGFFQKAPELVLVVIAIVAVAGWWFRDHIGQAEVNALKAQIANTQAQVANTQAQVTNIIEALEQRLISPKRRNKMPSYIG
jgi:hypothetical protein